MILADTSAWIEFDRATGSRVDRRLSSLIETDGPVAVTEPVATEILAGARTDRHLSSLRRLLARFELLAFETPTDFDAAATIYRRCRVVGVTPRGLLDCMVAAVALRHRATLLTADRDLSRISSVMGFDLDEASAR